MEKNIKISIVIPVYNAAKYLHKSLDSVVKQTLKEIEIICIDDCSTDESFSILQEYAAKDDRFVVSRNGKNQGQANVRNKGLEIAQGEFIMFLDNDDWLELNACELCYNQITKNNNDVVIFTYNKYYEKYGVLNTVQKTLKPYKAVENDSAIVLSDLDDHFIVSCYIWTLIYRKSFLAKNNIRFNQDYEPFEDQPFFIQTFIQANSISVIYKALYNYRIRNNSNTFLNPKKNRNFYKVKKDNLALINKYNVSNNFKKTIYIHTIRSSIHWYNRYVKFIPKIERKFYNNVRKIFLSMDQEYIENEIRPRLSEDLYDQYRYFIDNTYLKHWRNKMNTKLQSIKFINYKYLASTISWMFPTEEDRKNFRTFCEEIDERKNILQAQLNFPKIVERIKKKEGRIRVLFMVNELAKWKAQSLYDLMSKYEKFEPIMCLHIADIQRKLSKEDQNKIILDNKAFFESKGMTTVIAHNLKSGKPIDLKEFKPDIVFYQQPWDIYKIQRPKLVSRYALTCYIPYYVNNYAVLPMDYDQLFHKFLFRHYVLNKQWQQEYEDLSERKNIKGLGHTILDYFYLNKDKEFNGDYVIYAPHWSVPHKKNKNNENYGTFLWNGKEILEYAKTHPEIKWVFKPHPTLKHTLIKIGMPKDRVDDYYKEWEKIGKVCYDGSYMDLFMNSKALITDCGSFLTEYFCTGKPIIHLISPKCRIVPIEFAQNIMNTFYKVKNKKKMYKIFDEILVNNIDEKKEARLKALKKSELLNNYAAENILNDIINILN